MTNYSRSSYSPIGQSFLVETTDNKFLLSEPVSKGEMYQVMLSLLEEKYYRPDQLTSPELTRQYLQLKLARLEHEVFSVVFLDSQHQVITYEEKFRGTIDEASVYPREVVKRCLHHNVSAIILAHCHPSGVPEPSQADVRITKRLTEALSLIDVRVLDHIVVGGANSVSMAERGLL